MLENVFSVQILTIKKNNKKKRKRAKKNFSRNLLNVFLHF